MVSVNLMETPWAAEMVWVLGAEMSRAFRESRAAVPPPEAVSRGPVLHAHQATGLKRGCMVYILAAIH